MENNKENGQKGDEYLTITYHGTGSTSGEPPVDSNKYKLPVQSPATFLWISYDTTTVLDKGTMERGIIGAGTEHEEERPFYAWKIRDELYYEKGKVYNPGEKLNVYRSIDFDPIWY